MTLPLVAPNEALAGQVEEVHETLGTAGYWLVGVHTAAALFHHYVLRDGVLRRILPGFAGGGGSGAWSSSSAPQLARSRGDRAGPRR